MKRNKTGPGFAVQAIGERHITNGPERREGLRKKINAEGLRG
jgi:hypothetical protein